MAADSTSLTLTINGTDIPMRGTVSKAGNRFWAVMSKKSSGERYFSKYGVPIPPLGDDLPDFCEVDGEFIALSPDVTKSGNPKVTGSVTRDVDGRTYNTSVNISQTGPKAWNLIAKCIPSGGFGRAPVDLSDL